MLSRHEKTTVLFVTHDAEEAIYLSTRILAFSGRPGEIIHEMQKMEWERGGHIVWGFSNFVDGHHKKVQGLAPTKDERHPVDCPKLSAWRVEPHSQVVCLEERLGRCDRRRPGLQRVAPRHVD